MTHLIANNNTGSSSKIHFTLVTLCLLFSLVVPEMMAQKTNNTSRSVLAVFAHPDDEIYVAPVLSKYANQGAKVYLVIATDGRYGPGESGLPVGEKLVKLRKDELLCSAENLGIEEPITLGYHDQLKMQSGLSVHVPYARDLIKDLDSIITELAPEILITWGPDGGTNHPDHRLVGASVTHVFLSKKKGPSKLFYVGTPSEELPEEDKLLHGVDKKFLTTRIPFDQADFENTIAALQCYKSQFSSESMAERIQEMKKHEKVVYLRELLYSPHVNADLFE